MACFVCFSQLNQLSEELQCVRAEKDALLSEKVSSVESPAEEKEALLSTVTSLTAERDQLRMYLQENEQMVSYYMKMYGDQVCALTRLLAHLTRVCVWM